MVDKEFIVTGQLKKTEGSDRQMYMLHRSFFAKSKEQAIEFFNKYFYPDLTVMKIYSVVDEYGNQI
jgi:hypothetical protein